MANSGNKIGEAYVELRAKVEKLEADLARAKAESSAYADRMQADANRAALSTEQSTESIGKSLKKQVGGFTSLVGRVTAVIGVFTSFFQIGQRVSAMLETGAKRADDFLAGIAGGDSAAKVKQLNAEIDALNSKLEGSSSAAGYFGNLLFEGLTPSKIRDQVQRLEQARVSELRAVNAQSIREREAKAKAAADAEKKIEMERVADLLKWEQDMRDKNAEEDRNIREKAADDWAEAGKRAVDELADYERSVGQQTRDAQASADEDIRRRGEEFRRQMFDRNAVDIRRLERAIKFASLNQR